MENFWKGKVYLKIEKGSPFYGKGKTHDRCLKKLFSLFGYSVSLRVDNTLEIKEKYVEKLLKTFDSVEGNKAFKNNNVYYLDDNPWIIKYADDLETTDNPQVLYNRKINSYIGFSHRATQGFRIGDMLFTGKAPKDLHKFYCDKKLRWKMLKTLLIYHFKNDTWAFQDIFEDDLIGHGISIFIPFSKKGEKIIENKEEAYQAACNFANYVS